MTIHARMLEIRRLRCHELRLRAWPREAMVTVAYTDGACSGNPGPGGWGVFVEQRHEDNATNSRSFCGGAPDTTNNRMELTAAIKALEATGNSPDIEIRTDSRYLKNGIQSWIRLWKANRWKRRNGNAVVNVDLWKRLDELCSSREVHWRWVKGHAGEAGNEQADFLARSGMKPFLEARVARKPDSREHVSNDCTNARIVVYADGACSANLGPGGWGAFIRDSREGEPGKTTELSGGEPKTTANRMKMMAAIKALEALDSDAAVEIRSDSQYLVDGMRSWVRGWKAGKWKRKDGRGIANVDLWQKLDELSISREVHWGWARRNAGEAGNEQASILARSGMKPFLERRVARNEGPIAQEPGNDQRAAFLVHVDGVCPESLGPGGWGALVEDLRKGEPGTTRELSGQEGRTTINRMKLMAAINALEAMEERAVVEIRSENKYLIDGMKSWVRRWKANGWKKADGKLVLNVDLWKRLDELAGSREVHWRMTAGNAKSSRMRVAESLARSAMKP